MPMDDDDYALSKRISQRSKNDDPDNPLRQLLVHRLTVSFKAVIRRPLKPRPHDKNLGLFCEQCDQWHRIDGFPTITQCPGCNSLYRLETAIYEHVELGQLNDEQ